MMLIEDALAASRSVTLAPEAVIVWALYLAADAASRGRGSSEVAEIYLDGARASGIPDEEIKAALIVANGLNPAEVDDLRRWVRENCADE